MMAQYIVRQVLGWQHHVPQDNHLHIVHDGDWCWCLPLVHIDSAQIIHAEWQRRAYYRVYEPEEKP